MKHRNGLKCEIFHTTKHPSWLFVIVVVAGALVV